MNVLCIIPARGGSKGIPRKNLKVIAGKPLIAWSIEAALAAESVTRVIVSTDDTEIAAVSKTWGAEIINRPSELANDTASSESALMHVLENLRQKENYIPDLIVFLQATSPFRIAQDIDGAVELLGCKKYDSVFSAYSEHFIGRWQQDKHGCARPLNFDPASRPRRQDRAVEYVENGSIYIFRPSILFETGARMGGRTGIYLMPLKRSFQIDSTEDLELLNKVMTQISTLAAKTKTQLSHVPYEGEDIYFIRRAPKQQANYEDAYWGKIKDPDGELRDRLQEREQYLLDMNAELTFLNGLTGGKILDVGCGPGFLLSGLASRWERYGVEISKVAAGHARKYGEIFQGSLEDAAYPAEYFDMVVFHHVIEHLDDPLTTLREIRRVLCPGGWLILGTPDFDSAGARLFGSRYRLLHDQTHVSLFTRESMYRLLRDESFVIEKVDFPYFETRHFTKENLLRLLDRQGISPPFYGNFMTFYARKPDAGETIRSPHIQLDHFSEI